LKAEQIASKTLLSEPAAARPTQPEDGHGRAQEQE
jgi:hypothetical protein